MLTPGLPLTIWGHIIPGLGGGGFGIRLTGNSVAENSANSTVVGTAYISGTYTGTPVWAIVDASATFSIDSSTGVITVTDNTDLDYEVNTSLPVTIQVSGTTPDPTDMATSIIIIDVPGPTITSSTAVSVAENATLAHLLTADEAATWADVGGADQAQFDISTATLTWVADGTQDFEAPADANADNVYIVTVRATSVATGETTDQTISVTVTNVVEGGGADNLLFGSPDGLFWDVDRLVWGP